MITNRNASIKIYHLSNDMGLFHKISDKYRSYLKSVESDIHINTIFAQKDVIYMYCLRINK